MMILNKKGFLSAITNRLRRLCLLFLMGTVGKAFSSTSIVDDCSNIDVSVGQTTNPNNGQEFPADLLAICSAFDGMDRQPYLDWYGRNDIHSQYPNQIYMPGADPDKPFNGVAVHWKVEDEYVYLAIAARATGWVGFGIAETGGMIGTDMVIFEAAKPYELIDAYTADVRFPQIDDCSNDWQMINSIVEYQKDGFIMFETRRLLDTGDSQQDKVIYDDSDVMNPAHRVIAAWGDTEQFGYHTMNRSRSAIRFFQGATSRTATVTSTLLAQSTEGTATGTNDNENNGPALTFSERMELQAEGSFMVQSMNYEIPAVETHNEFTCFSRDDLRRQGVPVNKKVYVIGMEPVLSTGTEAYLHHFIVRASLEPSCAFTFLFNHGMAGWAPGERPFALDDDLGLPLFGDDGHQAYRIEVHYNNPNLDSGKIDSSGMRFYWTSQHREIEVGFTALGDFSVQLEGSLVGSGLTAHTFSCPGSCSAKNSQPVTVVREILHMHQTGVRMTNDQIRDGQVIRTGSTEYWDFDQAGEMSVQQPSFVVQPGDSFRTTCYYDNGNKNDTIFGASTQDEMCMAFMYYWPRKMYTVPVDVGGGINVPMELSWVCGYDIPFEGCSSTYTYETLQSSDDLGRTFGHRYGTCPGNK